MKMEPIEQNRYVSKRSGIYQYFFQFKRTAYRIIQVGNYGQGTYLFTNTPVATKA